MLLIGLFIGAVIGFATCSLLVIAGQEDRHDK